MYKYMYLHTSIRTHKLAHMHFTHTHIRVHTEISTQWPTERKNFDRTILPTAPRSVSQSNIDPRRLPSKPPYTVYLGNLSYECTEDDVYEFFERKKLTVSRAVYVVWMCERGAEVVKA